MTSYEDIADLPYAPSESDLKDPEYMGEPSSEWDVENYAAARSNWQNGAGDWDNYVAERANYRADSAALDDAENNLPFGKVN